jgi:hypothetical protein
MAPKSKQRKKQSHSKIAPQSNASKSSSHLISCDCCSGPINWGEWFKFFFLYSAMGIVAVEIVQLLVDGALSPNPLYVLVILVASRLAGTRGWSCAVG